MTGNAFQPWEGSQKVTLTLHKRGFQNGYWIGSRLELFYELAEKDRDTYSSQSRESSDNIFLRLIDVCEKSRNLAIEDLKAEFKHIAESVDGVERTEPIREH